MQGLFEHEECWGTGGIFMLAVNWGKGTDSCCSVAYNRANIVKLTQCEVCEVAIQKPAQLISAADSDVV
jgi:hypothetical protein